MDPLVLIPIIGLCFLLLIVIQAFKVWKQLVSYRGSFRPVVYFYGICLLGACISVALSIRSLNLRWIENNPLLATLSICACALACYLILNQKSTLNFTHIPLRPGLDKQTSGKKNPEQ